MPCASLGLPGLGGFVGEFLILQGVFPLAGWAAALALPGLLLTAVFVLEILRRVWNGPLNPRWSGWPDLTWRERLIIAPATALMFLFGLWPRVVLDWLPQTVRQLVDQANY